MLSDKARELHRQFDNDLMDCMCDSNYECITDNQDCYSATQLEICQAYAMAVCDAAKAHIENCYDTPVEDGEDRGRHLTVQHYVDWMHKELSNPALAILSSQPGVN